MKLDRLLLPKRGNPARNSRHGEELLARVSGIILMDASFNTIAFDTGAAQIFAWKGDLVPSAFGGRLPDEILNWVRARHPPDHGSHLHVLGRRYRCRVYDVVCEDTDEESNRVIAIHLESDDLGEDSDYDPIGPLVVRFGLTEREQQALRGIALGMTTKELAVEMRISPHTVRAFVRLIMIKLGVTTRGAIVGKLFEQSDPRRHMAMVGAAKSNSTGAGGKS